MRILVAVVAYPTPEGGVSLRYVHTRNQYYLSKGIEVDVLNFSRKENYNIDGIAVYTLESISSHLKMERYDLLICHAANLRNHYRFLKRYDKYFKKIIFFYHGHEVLKINKVYSKPYAFCEKDSWLKITARNIYDDFKFHIWRRYINKNQSKVYHIFVSNWMLNEFKRWVKPRVRAIKGRTFVSYNSVGEIFENETYSLDTPKEYDFITIRPHLDGSKYSVDIVNELAWKNPTLNFLLYGKGDFFKYFEKAPNLTWVPSTLNHSEIVEVLDKCRCALMPTRTDAQGVMMCEMATYGMPLITSDIPVCHEVFEDFDNVYLIPNVLPQPEGGLSSVLSELTQMPVRKNRKYFFTVVCGKEVEIINSVVDE